VRLTLSSQLSSQLNSVCLPLSSQLGFRVKACQALSSQLGLRVPVCLLSLNAAGDSGYCHHAKGNDPNHGLHTCFRYKKAAG
jgi:hypothetical protein